MIYFLSVIIILTIFRYMKKTSRRVFLDLLGKGTIAVTLLPYVVASCSDKEEKNMIKLEGIAPSEKDDLILIDGLSYELIISYGDPISDTDKFGFNNDFLCFVPFDNNPNEGILWSNHEYVDPLFIHGNTSEEKTLEEIKQEMYNIGGSLVHIKKEDEKWEVQYNSQYNRRLNGFTEISFNWDEQIEGSDKAIGTLGNCAGGYTPWGTVLTAEENYQDFYNNRSSAKEPFIEDSWLQWEKFYPNHLPEHYGWITEINPKTGEAQKHVALGRCAHECATVVSLPDERVVVYTGDDHKNECLYKFISSKPKSLKEGTLYVANTQEGKWEAIDIEQQPVLKEKFLNQTQALTYLRESSKLVGGTPLDRPEDIEIDPFNGNVLVTLTNNIPKENYFGSILKIEEEGGKHDALTFKSSVHLEGGVENGFACPDNMVFDRKGNLWFTSDISGKYTHGEEHYASFKNNGLFILIREGEQAGEVIQVASAPVDAELTGPWFSPDGETLFLSVQHPGETTKSLDQLTSNWPNGNGEVPKPSVVAIQGEFLKEIQG